MSAHESTGPSGCTCRQPGFTARLTCGCWSWTHGRPRIGLWITCGASLAHQSGYQVLEVREGGNTEVMAP